MIVIKKKNEFFKLSNILFFSIIVFLFSACSTKKNTFTSRTYHNLTAHYNAYFNGNESMKEGIRNLNATVEDDFTTFIPLNNYGALKQAQAIFPQMVRAFEKGSKVINKHSMLIKNVEYCRWVDDAYMMIAKSHFYKQDYDIAIEVLEYIQRQYTNPIKYEASIWLAKCHIQKQDYDKAVTELVTLKDLLSKNESFKSTQSALPIEFAEVYLKQKNYTAAREQITKALALKQDRKLKARAYFVLGQIYQYEKKNKEATEAYKKVLKLSPSYKLAFNTRINMAKCYEGNADDAKYITKTLLKMAKDGKNAEFLDQIYFALAEIMLKQKNEEEAIKYFKLSAQSSVSNDKQKALSYLALADLLFNKSQYENCQMYYDSAVGVLPKNFENYNLIVSKRNILNSLVESIVTIKTEDSLQKLAKLSPSDLNLAIDAQIKYNVKEMQRKQDEENQKQQMIASTMSVTQNASDTKGSNWYFYNSQTLSFGFTEFSRKWGNRQLKDLWRLSNQEMVMDENSENNVKENADSNQTKDKSNNNNIYDKKNYMKNIPLTEESMVKSNNRIIEAYYNIGNIYKDNLQEPNKSIDAYETLNKRYINHKYLIMSYYQLHKLNLEINNIPKAEYYKNLILTQYSETDYAQILRDPENFAKTKSSNAIAQRYYNEAYIAFNNSDYHAVNSFYLKAKTEVGTNVLMAKFDYLNALVIGKTKTEKEFSDSLNVFVKKYPTHELKTNAQNIIDYINSKSKSINDTTIVNNTLNTDTIKKQTEKYSINDEAIFFFVLMFDIQEANTDEIKSKISDFNSEYFGNEELGLNDLFLNDRRYMVRIANFQGKDKAMQYYTAFNENINKIGLTAILKANHFIITSDNYVTLFKTKDEEGYLLFFKKYFVNK